MPERSDLADLIANAPCTRLNREKCHVYSPVIKHPECIAAWLRDPANRDTVLREVGGQKTGIVIDSWENETDRFEEWLFPVTDNETPTP